MNRPFGALGSLAAMLALAMLAVSSSSRSTTVGPGPASRHEENRATSRDGYLTANQRRCARPETRPDARPEANDRAPIAECPAACDRSQSSDCKGDCKGDTEGGDGDGECDETPAINLNHWSCEFAATQAATPAPSSSEELAESPSSISAASGLKSAQLEAAEPVASLPSYSPAVDCRAGYDATDDELIYGADCDGEPSDALAPASGGAARLDSAEVIELFRSIFRLSGPEISANTSQRKMPLHAGGQSHMHPISWSEYGELIDGVVAEAGQRLRTGAPAAENANVRSSRGVLHSAAAIASHLKQLLNWAAIGIDDISTPSAIATATGTRQ